MKTKLVMLLPLIAMIAFLVVWTHGGRDVPTAIVDHGNVEVFHRVSAVPWLRDRYTLRAPVDAHLMEVTTPVGEEVQAGDSLVELFPFPDSVMQALPERMATELQLARQDAEAARVRVEHAREEHERSGDAFAGGEIDAQAMERAAYALKDALLQLRSAEFAIDVSRHALDSINTVQHRATTDSRVLLRAAVNGVVLAHFVTGDEIVQAGQPLLEIADPGSLELHVCLTQQGGAHIDVTTPVWLSTDELQVEGRVRRVGMALAHPDDCSRTGLPLQAVIDPIMFNARWWRFRGIDPVEATFLVWSAAQVLRLPTEAIYQQEDRSMVYVVRDGRAYGTPVTLGSSGERFTEVRAGVVAGDIVVLRPASVTDGMRIRQ